MFENKRHLNGIEKFLDSVERLMVAVTFAEAGERDTALQIANEKKASKKRKHNRRTVDNRVDNPPVLTV